MMIVFFYGKSVGAQFADWGCSFRISTSRQLPGLWCTRTKLAASMCINAREADRGETLKSFISLVVSRTVDDLSSPDW